MLNAPKELNVFLREYKGEVLRSLAVTIPHPHNSQNFPKELPMGVTVGKLLTELPSLDTDQKIMALSVILFYGGVVAPDQEYIFVRVTTFDDKETPVELQAMRLEKADFDKCIADTDELLRNTEGEVIH